MKKRRQLISLLTAIAMTSALIGGCGQNTQENQNTQESQETDAADDSGAEEKTSDAEWDTGKEDTITLSVINNF